MAHVGGRLCNRMRAPSPLLHLSRPTRLSKFDAEGVLADYPLPFDAMEEPELPAAGGRTGKGAAKTPARGGRRAAAADDSSEDEEDTGPQMPSDDDDEEEDQVGRKRAWEGKRRVKSWRGMWRMWEESWGSCGVAGLCRDSECARPCIVNRALSCWA